MEPADVGGPPWDAREGDVEPGPDLGRQGLEGGGDVARPQGRPPALATGPRRADQADHLGLADRVHALIDGPGVVGGVAVEHLGPRAGCQAQVVDVAGPYLGLAGVQPEDLDAVAVVIGP